MKCPQCTKEMEHGYIHGNKATLKWSNKEKEYTVFAGESIGSSVWSTAWSFLRSLEM